jgi:hypothetical protein
VSETKIAPIPTHVAASVDKTGRERPAHIAVRHKKVSVADEDAPEAGTRLDAFIAKHGGPAHLRETLEKMEGHERAKLLDAMAHVDGTDAAAVMKKLGIHEPQTSADTADIEKAKQEFRAKLDAAKEGGVITAEEYATLIEIYEKDGIAAAVQAATELRAPPPAALPEPPVATPEGDTGPSPVAESAEGGGGLRASLLAQADEIYQRHVSAANAAHRAAFDVEKRRIRGWKVPAQIAEAPDKHRADAERYLQEWRDFCQANGLTDALS